MADINDLFKSLKERWLPEYVVKTILEINHPSLTTADKALLQKALPRWATTSMPQSFRTVVGLQKQLDVARELFPSVTPPKTLSSRGVRLYLNRLKLTLKIEDTDFESGRLSHKARKRQVKQFSGHRAYNKRFRLLGRMEERFKQWTNVAEIQQLAQISKSRLASQIDTSTIKDVETASFIAYITAKLNKRSVFTFGKQERAYDNIADMLFKKLGRGTSWLSVAYVHPMPEVLQKLSDKQKGELLGVWYAVMRRAAKILSEEVKTNQIDLKQMIVRLGNDSSTWNEAAGAYNKARDGWINTLYALGMSRVLDVFAPGKALRLMAADVAWGHRHYGDGLDPNTAIWNELPKPWEVIFGNKVVTRQTIETACHQVRARVDGWVAPRPKVVVDYTPTPELVHGVTISSPYLAEALKKSGYFGGPTKKVKSYVPITKNLVGPESAPTVVVSQGVGFSDEF